MFVNNTGLMSLINDNQRCAVCPKKRDGRDDHLPGGGQDYIPGRSGKRVLWNQVLGSTKTESKIYLDIQAATTPGIADGGRGEYGQRRLGTVTAQATLEANGVQDLADQIPEITMAAVGHQLRFNIQIELSGDNPPDTAVVEGINSLLAVVSEDLKLQ